MSDRDVEQAKATNKAARDKVNEILMDPDTGGSSEAEHALDLADARLTDGAPLEADEPDEERSHPPTLQGLE